MGLTLDSSFQNVANKKLGGIPHSSVQAVLSLSAEGNTVPFIARYRKEKTGNLDEVQIRSVIEAYEQWQEVVKRKEFVLGEIEKQGNLTPELKLQIEKSWELAEVEELYRPYKRKKKTKATLAKEAGIEPFAQWIWGVGHGEISDSTSLEVKAKEFLNPGKSFATYEEVMRGAQHIIVERISNNPDLRAQVRKECFENGKIVSAKTTKFKTHSKYEMYGEFSESVKTLQTAKASHRYLALRRGWQEGELKVTIEVDEAALLEQFNSFACSQVNSQAAPFLLMSAKQALSVHVIPSVSNELHRMLKDAADEHAINVFAENVRRVLMSSPFGAKVVLGVDPGLKTGCKVSLVDRSSQYVSNTVMHILGEKSEEAAVKLFGELLNQIKIDAIAVGNGTGGREAEAFIRKVLKTLGKDVPVIMVNESGASVYSASDVARKEFPDLDLTVRGAISIARRLQDPLAELVKIEPKSIGVGQYQHDVSQTQLKKSLHDVVESCVNQVGVDLNTASESLLQYASGIGPAIAKNVVAYRQEHGIFKDRNQLLKVPQFSSKAFEQAAGFLRVVDGDVPLDRTGIHPERYSAVREMAKDLGMNLSQVMSGGVSQLKQKRDKWAQLVGEYTFDDIVAELEKPGRDPRDPYKVFQFREDIHEVKDLKKDMICPGLVTNVTNFGAFVDIGVHQDGLVHISEISHDFISDPRQVVSPGDQVKVKVLGVDKDKNQISLSMLLEERKTVRARTAGAQKERPKSAKGKSRKDSGQRNKGKGPRTGKGQGPRGKGPRRGGQPFNNPFAALADIKK